MRWLKAAMRATCLAEAKISSTFLALPSGSGFGPGQSTARLPGACGQICGAPSRRASRASVIGVISSYATTTSSAASCAGAAIADSVHVLRGEHADHAGRFQRRRGIDTDDAGEGMGRADEIGIGLVRQ